MKLRAPAQDPKWVAGLYYLAATLSAVAIGLLRSAPWNKGSAAALLLAWACCVGAYRAVALLVFKQPAARMLLTFAALALVAGTASVILR
jgi:hypothetical protein